MWSISSSDASYYVFLFWQLPRLASVVGQNQQTKQTRQTVQRSKLLVAINYLKLLSSWAASCPFIFRTTILGIDCTIENCQEVSNIRIPLPILLTTCDFQISFLFKPVVSLSSIIGSPRKIIYLNLYETIGTDPLSTRIYGNRNILVQTLIWYDTTPVDILYERSWISLGRCYYLRDYRVSIRPWAASPQRSHHSGLYTRH